MAFPSPPEPELRKVDPHTELFYRRFHRHYDLRMKKLLKEHSQPPSSRTEGRDYLNTSSFLPAHDTHHHKGTLLTPLSHKAYDLRKAPNVYTQILSVYSKGRRGKRKTSPEEAVHSGFKSSEKGLRGVTQIVTELKAMFEKMPKSANTPSTENRMPAAVSPQSSPIEIIPLPRISVSTTPRRQATNDPLRSQRRGGVSSRRVKDQVDLVGLHQYFADFHEKSRDLVQRLEAKVGGT